MKWAYSDEYLSQTMWNHAKNSMKKLKRANSLFLQCEISSAVLKTWITNETKTRITQNFQILYPIQGACFTNVDKFVTITSACRCLLHMHAGVYYTCVQVSMTPARRCPWYLHADVYYTCLQVTIAQKVTQIGMQLSMTPARRCLWQQHADVFDTCT